MSNEPTTEIMNATIAIFMGYEQYQDRSGTWFKKEGLIICMHPRLDDLCYHKSWDALMEVVEKIGTLAVKSTASYNPDLRFRIEIVNGYTEIEGTGEVIFFNSSIEGSMLMATYKAVHKFIDWYNDYTDNQQKQNDE